MKIHRAAWILPISAPPIRKGWVAIDEGRIAAVGGSEEEPPPGTHAIDGSRESSPSVILPGLVNAHTHLELSWMRGKVAPDRSMPAWTSRLMALRRTVSADPVAPVYEAISSARDSGTCLVGDITNTLASEEPLRGSPLSALLFRELIGFSGTDPAGAVRRALGDCAALPVSDRLQCSIAPHAPYSVSPELFTAIAAATHRTVVSVHLGESPEEVEFLRCGGGAWRELLEGLGVWNPGWRAPGCGPVAYLSGFGLVTEKLLAVHAVQLTDTELATLASAGSTIVTCPRSNVWTGVGMPPADRFYSAGVRVAVGTDSLASVDDLNMFSEIAALRQAAVHVPAAAILQSATRIGAEALGFGRDLGTIEPGKRAELIAVRIPRDVQDVEEYLLSGVQPAAVRWLEDSET